MDKDNTKAAYKYSDEHFQKEFRPISVASFIAGADWRKAENDWHDLKINPNDLPEHREIVLVEMEFDTCHYAIGAYSQINGEWYLREDDEFCQTNKRVIKSQKINK